MMIPQQQISLRRDALVKSDRNGLCSGGSGGSGGEESGAGGRVLAGVAHLTARGRMLAGCLLLVLAGGVFGGCGKSSPPSATAPTVHKLETLQGKARELDGKPLRIVLIPESRQHPPSVMARRGAERAAQRLQGVRIEVTAPVTIDASAQAALLKRAISQKADGVLLSPSAPAVLLPVINQAEAAGIPVITYGRDVPGSQRTAYYGVHNHLLGYRLGEEMARLLKSRKTEVNPTASVGLAAKPGQQTKSVQTVNASTARSSSSLKIRIAVLSAGTTSPVMQERLQGLSHALAAFPAIEIIKVFDGGGDAAKSARLLAQVTRTHKPQGWVLLGNWPLLDKQGLSSIATGQTLIVGVDPVPATWKWIEQKRVQVMLAPKFDNWGEEGVKLLVRAKQQKVLPGNIDTGVEMVTPQNLASYRRQWSDLNSSSRPTKRASPQKTNQRNAQPPKTKTE